MTEHTHDLETERLEALRQCQVLDTDPEDVFDDITRLAAHICGVPIAAVSLVDAHRQWFKSIQGLDVRETGRDVAFCAHTIHQPDLMVIPDAQVDARFADNPLVTGTPNIRFYAGAPLITEDGHALGALCVLDRTPRQLTPEQQSALRLLARQATAQLEAARHAAAQERLIAERARAEDALRRSEARLNEAQRLARIGSWEYDIAAGRLLWSEQLFRLFEMDPADGEPTVEALMTRYHPDDVAMHQDVSDRAMRDGRPYEFDIRLLRLDGSVRWGHASGRAERDASGGIARLVGTFADIHERKCSEEAQRKSEEAFRAVMEGAPVILYAVDSRGVVTLSEGAGLARLGLTPGEVVGRSVFGMYPEFSETESCLRRALAGEAVSYDSTAGGLHYHNELRPQRDESGAVTGVIAMAYDVTERWQAEEAVRRSEERLAEAQRIAHLGSWEYEVDSGRIVAWSAELFRLYEFAPAFGTPELTDFLARHHPEDLPERNRRFAEAVATGCPYEYDTRLLLPSGTPRWCHVVGRPITDGSGQVIRVVGTVSDITERVMSEERFRVLFERSSDSHLLFDETGIIDCNHAAVALLGCADKSQMLSLHPAALSPEFQPDGRRSDEKCIEMDRLAQEAGFHRFEWTHRKMDGEEFPVEVTLTPVTLRDRPVLLVVWHDLSDRKQAEQQAKDYAVVLEFQKEQLEAANAELESLATTDGLTGLKNHRAFQERLSEEQERVRRQGTPLSVVLLDVDTFKGYNDTYGHPAGDEILRKVARLLRGGARETDTVARYGGEEFVLILPQTDYAAGLMIAERIRKSIEANAWPLRPVTASFGVATLRPEDADAGSLIARADRALYRSKQGGRNRVTGEERPPCPQ